MSGRAQIPATIAAETVAQLDRFTERHGLDRDHVIEQALLYFMESRRHLPDEALVPTRIVLEDGAFDQLTETLADPPAPPPALRDLLAGRPRYG